MNASWQLSLGPSVGSWPRTACPFAPSKGARHATLRRPRYGSWNEATAYPESSSVATARPPHAAAAPPLPQSLHADIAAARRSWLERCVSSPLVDATTNSRVHLCGVVHFAPHGGPAGMAELIELIERVRPTILAIEQPFDLAARAGLPYPEVIQEFAALLPAGAQVLSGSGGSIEAASTTTGTSAVAPWQAAAAAADAEMQAAAVAVQAARLAALLPGLARPARVGRDMLDPFEVLGLYGGCDYVTRPAQLAEALALFGWLPGLEYAVAAAQAQEMGVQVYSVDAPLRLQEQWVAQLVADFTLREADLARRLAADLAATQTLLPPAYGAWDAELAAAVRRMEAAAVPPAAAEAEGGASGGASGGDGREPPLRTATAFKVSRAVAAAMLPYEGAREAFALQAGLQPLKWGLFARRARHLVLQVRDLCQRMAVRQVRVDAGVIGAAAVGGNDNSNANAADGDDGVSLVDASGRPEQVVLLVAGRQYIPYIEEMWANERSALWHGEVPRTFAPSSINR